MQSVISRRRGKLLEAEDSLDMACSILESIPDVNVIVWARFHDVGEQGHFVQI